MGYGLLWLCLLGLAALLVLNRLLARVIISSNNVVNDDETIEFLPTVTVVMPMFNESRHIVESLRSVLALDYPDDKLHIVCIDDCSSDETYSNALGLVATSRGRLTVVRNAVNIGKRKCISDAVRTSESEIMVSIDSDVVVEPDAVRHLVCRFVKDDVAAVGGWVDVRNKHDNWLSKVQTVTYWYAYFAMRKVQGSFRKVMNLSGCLTAYRRSVLLELDGVVEHRSVCGVPIKYGEDRFLTRQIIKAGYSTRYTQAARCRTMVPTSLGPYFSQQLRWRRSNLIDYLGGCSHMWRLHPLIAVNYFCMFALLVTYPLALGAALATGHVIEVSALHGTMYLGLGLRYQWSVRNWPRADRVSGLWFGVQALLLPVTYAWFVILAAFTLDSQNWETRQPPRV
jgi:cellulose synthase/poly-beta-1,6-N-acetylglucosamine synthase-like glycosyltransferase